jgi:hypothetical protein
MVLGAESTNVVPFSPANLNWLLMLANFSPCVYSIFKSWYILSWFTSLLLPISLLAQDKSKQLISSTPISIFIFIIKNLLVN